MRATDQTIPMDLTVDGRRDQQIAPVDPNSEAEQFLLVDAIKEKIWPNLMPSARARLRVFVNEQVAKDYTPQARMILEFLNTKRPGKTGYKPVESNLSLIRARLMEGYTVEQLRGIVAIKAGQVDRNEFPPLYFRPATLFNATRCAQYVGELGARS